MNGLSKLIGLLIPIRFETARSNIERKIVAPKTDTMLCVELQVEGDVEPEYLKEVFVEAGVTVTEIAETEAKELD